jgi:hypothetical protein
MSPRRNGPWFGERPAGPALGSGEQSRAFADARPLGGSSLAQFIDRFVLGEKMVLPLDALTRRLAVLGPPGGAKTNPATVLVEELVADQLPVVILDPTGTWYGLGLATDGIQQGLPISVVGGPRGGLELREQSGAMVADFAVDLQRPLVLDLSSLGRRGMARFVADFSEQLARRRPRPIHLVMADANAVQSEDSALGNLALEALLSAAESGAVGLTLISETPGAARSSVLADVDVVVSGRVAADEDAAVVRAWLRTHAVAADVARQVFDTLTTLRPDEAWICSPRWLGVVERVTLRHRATYDAARSGPSRLRPPQSRASAAELDRLRSRFTSQVPRARLDPAPRYEGTDRVAPRALERRQPLRKRRRGRPVEDLVLTPAERSILLRYTKHAESAPQLAMRARIVLSCAEGRLNGRVARDLGISIQMVGRWRRRFLQEGLRGLQGYSSAPSDSLETS